MVCERTREGEGRRRHYSASLIESGYTRLGILLELIEASVLILSF